MDDDWGFPANSSEYEFQYGYCKNLVGSTFTSSYYPDEYGHIHLTSGICVLNYFATSAAVEPKLLPPDRKDVHGLVSCAELPVQQELLLKHLASDVLLLEWSDPCIALETRCYKVPELDSSAQASLKSNLVEESHRDYDEWSKVAYVSLDCTDDYENQEIEELFFGPPSLPQHSPRHHHDSDGEKRGKVAANLFFPLSLWQWW